MLYFYVVEQNIRLYNCDDIEGRDAGSTDSCESDAALQAAGGENE